jgi:hypothetical protein
VRSRLIAIVILISAVPVEARQARPQAATAATQLPSEIEPAVAKLRTTIQDPASTEADLAKARDDLEKIAEQLDKMTPPAARDTDVPGPLATAQLEVRGLLAKIAGRLGPRAEPAGRSIRAARVAALPVPEFEEGRTTHELANALRAAQIKLGEHLRGGGAPSDEQIADIVVEQERLAWEAAWPLTAEEAKQLKTLKAAQDRAKRKTDAAAANELDRQIGEFVARRRARGLVMINTQLLQEALSVGRDSSPAFAIHRPTTRSGQRLVARRLAEMIAVDTGLHLQPEGPGVAMLSIGMKPFDANVLSALRGGR